MFDRRYEIRPGLPIRACDWCGADVVDLPVGAAIITVNYAGGPFPQRGTRHQCAFRQDPHNYDPLALLPANQNK